MQIRKKNTSVAFSILFLNHDLLIPLYYQYQFLQSFYLLCFQRPTFEVAELPAPMSPTTAGSPTEASSSFNFNNLPPLNTRRQSENPSNFRHPAPAPLSSASFSARRHSEFPSSQPQLSSTSFRNLPSISTRGNANMTGEPPSRRNLFTIG